MSVSASPAGDAIVFDLLGDLYVVDWLGGTARPLTSGPEWDIEPRFSPDGTRIGFVSDRDGTRNVWLVEPDGTGLQQVSQERFEGVGSPTWSPDGSSIYTRQKRAQRSFTYKDVWVINEYRVADGSRREIIDETMSLAKQHPRTVQLLGVAPTGPSPGPDGSTLYFAAQTGDMYLGGRTYVEYQIMRLDLAGGEMVAVTSSKGGAFRPEISPDGRFLAFGRREADVTSLWLRDLTSGHERRLLAGITRDDQGNRSVDDLIPAFSWTADSQSIVIGKDGGIVRVDAHGGDVVEVPFTANVHLQLTPRLAPTDVVSQDPVDARIIRWHRLSPDGEKLAFQALGKIWLMDLPDGGPVPLNAGVTPSAYEADELFEIAPAWSPDGAALAYAVWGKNGEGHIHVKELDTGVVKRITTQPAEYSNLAYSPDGRTLCFTVALPKRHFLDRPGAQIRTIDLRSGRQTTVASTKQGFPAPIFSADGKRIFYVTPVGRSARQLVSVNPDGGDGQAHLQMDWLSEAVPSPDNRRVALVVHDNLYTVELPADPAANQPVVIETPAVLERVSSAAASPAWAGADTVVWGFGDRFHTATPGVPAERDEIRIRLQVPRDRPVGLVALTGAKIVTMTDRAGGIIENGDLMIEDNRIVRVGPSGSFEIPDGAHHMDVRGTTILPGFADMHAHPVSPRDSGLIEQQVRGLQEGLAYGVTTIHDPAGDTWYMLGAAELVETGQILGPRYYGAGAQVVGYSAPHNEWIDSLDTAREIVERRKRLGVMTIKEYGQPSRIQRQWLRQAARESDMRIINEGTGGFHLPLSVAVDGYTGIEHSIAQVPLYRDVVTLLAFSQIVYDPLLVGPRGGAGARSYFGSQLEQWEDEKLLRYVDRHMIEYQKKRAAAIEHAPHDYVFIAQGRQAHKIARANGRVVAGSHGAGVLLHLDIWGYVQAGMTPMEALHTATLSGIEAIGLESDLGTLEAGKLADFVVLDADPLDDIRNTMHIRYVAKNGRVYDDESLHQVWPEKKTKPAPFWLHE